MFPKPLSLVILKRGLYRRCPACGDSSMFDGYLTIAERCAQCGLEFELIRSDDAPAYFTIALVGHILLPLISYVEYCYSFSLKIHLLLWPPIVIGMTLGFLPFIKGLMMAVTWLMKFPPSSDK